MDRNELTTEVSLPELRAGVKSWLVKLANGDDSATKKYVEGQTVWWQLHPLQVLSLLHQNVVLHYDVAPTIDGAGACWLLNADMLTATNFGVVEQTHTPRTPDVWHAILALEEAGIQTGSVSDPRSKLRDALLDVVPEQTQHLAAAVLGQLLHLDLAIAAPAGLQLVDVHERREFAAALLQAHVFVEAVAALADLGGGGLAPATISKRSRKTLRGQVRRKVSR